MKKDPYAPLRAELDKNEPPAYWRSIEQSQGSAELKADVDAEFPRGVTGPNDWNRRDALKLGAAALALGGMACDEVKNVNLPLRRPVDEILPYVRMPENLIPGNRTWFATAHQRSEGALGLLVEAHEGRPTKIEGNPSHPASLGASDVWAQAEVLRLYDPERARKPLEKGAPSSWEKWDAFAKDTFARFAESQGKGLALMIGEEMGPTFERVLKVAQGKYPQAKVVRWDPLTPDAALQGAELAFGPGSRVHFTLVKAHVVFSLDSDFLSSGPEHLRLSREWAAHRSPLKESDTEKMGRLYASEGVFSNTAANADHRVRLSSSQQVDLLKALARELAKNGIELGELANLQGGELPADVQKFVAVLAKDLAANKNAALVVTGERQPAAVHALAYAISAALGGLGNTFTVSQAPGTATARVSMHDQLAGLVASLESGEVDTLVVFDQNPLYAAAAGTKFAAAFAKAKTTVHLGVLPEETGLAASWHLPQNHFLESWGDARAYDGTVSIVQPLVMPLFGGRTSHTVLAQLAGETETNDKALVELTWRGAVTQTPSPAPLATGGAADGGTAPAPVAAPSNPAPAAKPDAKFALADLKTWRRALHDGIVAGQTREAGKGEVNRGAVAQAAAAVKVTVPNKDALELVPMNGHTLNGRLTNVSWVMELPDTMTKLCWDNAVVVSPKLAKELGIESGAKKNRYVADLVDLVADGRKITIPAFVLPGLNPYTVMVNTGYGRKVGDIAKDIGVDVGPLLGANGGVLSGVKLTRTSSTAELCSTQDHFTMPGNPFNEMTFAEASAMAAGARERKLGLGPRPLYRTATGKQWEKDGEKTFHAEHLQDAPEELIQLRTPGRPTKLIQTHGEVTYEGQQWGMVIDLSSCTGCNACTIACIAENNIPVVGREQVMLGRELHWIRIDRYFTGDVDDPKAVSQPVTCMHCENAPCEPVCPVGATVHDEEGINSMAYNRCIGTRYCNNNCPYKVRRFNYLDFSNSGNVWRDSKQAERWKTLKLQRNPDVTVRYRGVMEKCTYCTQRVEEAKRAAKRAGLDRKAIPDGTITPACAQACATGSIVFGNINDEKSRVHQLKVSERNYEMLQELNVRPRTSYLARVTNPNEELSS
ncbi:MAG: TAT-variant-translocated molybdopterin oxidoreductase [Myxococcaceae bacterium]|nr:TAT-variant-translocated molybdopterin oxidoreductase [Myxococcaceae bacterium]